MIRTVAKKELLTSIRTVRFVVVVLVCCLLTPMSVWVLSSDYLKEVEDYQGRVDLEARRETGKELVLNVNRPVPELSALFRGINPESINSITLKVFVGWNLPIAAATQSVTHDIFPTVDLTFIIGVILSALALMLSFDAVSGEKADATLKLMMSNSVPRSAVVLGKWLGLSATLFIPLLLGMVISLLIFFATTGVQLSTDNWTALAAALIASAFTSRRSTSIFSCLAAWGLLVIVLPQAANAVSEMIDPIPTAQEAEKNIRLFYNDFAETLRKTNMDYAGQAKREGWSDGKAIGGQYTNALKMSIKSREDINNFERDFWLQASGQENIGRTVGLASPYSALTHVLISLADTGPEVQRDFLLQAYRYGERFFREIHTQRFSNLAGPDYPELIAQQPKFQFEGPSFVQRLQNSAWPLAALVIMNILLVVVGVIAFNRYDVR
jgi:ABC-type transport system involved in multi-copper enzyme maturation permease subunit